LARKSPQDKHLPAQIAASGAEITPVSNAQPMDFNDCA
jgi:hypothetical protein